MRISVIGTGFIGGTLGRALAAAGNEVTFGSRHPETDELAGGESFTVTSIDTALAEPDVVILAVPGGSVADLTENYGGLLDGKLVIDATNKMGEPVSNSRAALPDTVRYARAFNTLGGENFADPVFADGPADLFFSAPEQDRGTVEQVIADVGLQPVYIGADQEDILDALFKLWIALAFQQNRGRRLALRLIDR